jgi:hypothetical protein
MIGLILSEVILYAVAALAGFAIGWRICFRHVGCAARAQNEREIEQLRAALTEAQVRRARVS